MKKMRIIMIAVLAALLVAALAGCNHEHQYVTEVIEPATCTESGVSKDTCSLCGQSKGEEEVPPLGHNYEEADGKKVWSYDSAQHWYECTRCGNKDSLGAHNLNADNECSCGFSLFDYDETEDGYVLSAYNGADKVISVPQTYKGSPVVAIKAETFAQNKTITEIHIPASIKRIGRDAFLNCTALETTRADSVAAWCAITFENFASNPNHVAKTFLIAGSELGEELTIDSGIESIGAYAFLNVGTIKRVNIPASLTRIGYRAFEGAFAPAEDPAKSSAEVTVTVPDLAKWCAIDFGGGLVDADRCTANPLWYNATLVAGGKPVSEALDLSGVTSVSDYAFAGYDKIDSATFSNVTIGKYSFAHCVSLATVSVSGGMSEIPASAFEGCSALDSLTLTGVEKVGDRAFYGCQKLASLDLSGVQTVGEQAFYGCSALTTIEGVDDLTRIGAAAFHETAWLTPKNGAIYLGKVLYSYVGQRSGDLAATLEIAPGTTAIADGALSNVAYLKTVIIPDTVTYIGANAFRMTGLVVNPSISTVKLGSGVVEIGENAFAGNTALAYIEAPASLKTVGANAFAGCTGLKGVYIESVAAWCGVSFANAQANPLALAGKLYIGKYPEGDATLQEVTELDIPAETTTIGAYAFYGCTGLRTIKLPVGVSEIGASAFANCTRLTAINYAGTREQWDDVELGLNALTESLVKFAE